MNAKLVLTDAFSIEEVSETARDIMAALLSSGGVELDMKNVSTADTAAAQLLVAAKKEAECSGQSIVLNTSGQMDYLLKSIGVEL